MMATHNTKQILVTGANVQESKPQAYGTKRLPRARRSELQASLVPVVLRLTPTRLHDVKIPKMRRQRLLSPRSLTAVTTKSPRKVPRRSTKKSVTSSMPTRVIEAPSKEQRHSAIDITGESHDVTGESHDQGSGVTLSQLTKPLKSQGSNHVEGSIFTDDPADRGSTHIDTCGICGEASSSSESCGTASKRAAITRKKRKKGRPKSASTKGSRRKSKKAVAPTCEGYSAACVGGQLTIDASEGEDIDSILHVTKRLPLVQDSLPTSSDDPSNSAVMVGASVEPSVNEPLKTEGDAECETDYSTLELEYCPLTPQQKLVRKLARQKQLEEMRVREAAMAREERFLRRQGLLKERKRAERRIRWKRDSDLVQMFLYSPANTTEDSSA